MNIATPTTRARFDWRVELLVLSLCIAEATVLWLLIDLLLASTRDDSRRLSALAVFVLVYAGTALPRWFDALDLWDRAYGTAVAVAVASSTLIAIKVMSFPEIGWADLSWIQETARGLIARPDRSFLPVWGSILVSAYAWW